MEAATLDDAGQTRGPPPPAHYRLFLAGMGSWFTSWGMLMVLFQWLVVEELGVGAASVGTAQMALTLPSLLFLLVGGAVADRVDRRRALMLLHALAGIAVMTLALLVASDLLSYRLLIGYAFVMGSLQAMVIPTRDAQLSDVIDARMSRAVAGLTMVQHGGQGVGALAASLAGLVGAPIVLGLQSLIAFLGVWPLGRLPRRERPADESRPPLHLGEFQAGLLEVLHTPVLRVVFVVNVTVGLTFVSAYLVLLPLLVRDLYGGGVGKMAMLAGLLPVGSVIVNLWIIGRGGILGQGRSLLLGQALATAALAGLATGPPFWGACIAVFCWGIGGAFAINATRTLFQEHASAANRGRVLSVYSLAILGTASFGTLITGFVAEQIGTLGTLGVQAAAMTVAILALLALSDLRHFR